MADILLQKPEAGQTTTLTPAPEDRLVFEFNSGDALLTRAGDNLVMSFEDGSSLTLTDFYVAYTSENMPEFVIDDAVVPGEAFFAALGDELMPAAGPAAGPQGGGTTVGTISPELLDGGLDSLSGRSIDVGSRAAGEGIGSTFATDGPPTINGVIAFADAGPDASANALDVFESGVGRDVSGALSPNSPNQQYGGDFVASGRIDATDPEGLGLTYSIAGSTQGALGSINMNPDTGEFTYTFTGDVASDSLAQGETRQEIFTAVVEDPAGNSDTVQIVITVTGTNDRPLFVIEDAALEELEKMSVTDTFNNPHLEDTQSAPDFVKGSVEGFDVDNGHVLEYSVSHINPNLLDNKAIYEDLEKVLEQVKNFKDGVAGSPVVEGLGDVLAQFEATDFTAYLEKVSETLPKIENALNDGLANILGKVTDAADTSAAMQEVTGFLQGEFSKLDDLVGHPISEAIVGKFTDLMNNEIGKLPQEADKLDAIVQGLMKSLQDILTDSLGDLFDKFQADFDALVAQIGALEDFADDHPLSDIIANANAAVDGFLGQLQEAVENAKDGSYVEDSTVPSTATVATGLYGKLVLDTAVSADSADSGNFTYTLYTEAEAKAMGPEFEAAFWALQMRDDGEQALDTEHFTIYVRDEHGAWDYKNISIDVMGKNDAPVIHHVNDMIVQERGEGIIVDDKFLPNAPDLGMPVAVGQVVASDIDVEALTFSVKGADSNTWTSVSSDKDLFDVAMENDYGTLYLNSQTGTYMFELDNAKADSLNEGEDYKFDLTFTVTDNQKDGTSFETDEKTVTLTVEGTNDKPELSLTQNEYNVHEFLGDDNDAVTGDAREQGPASVTGQATVKDADADGKEGETQELSIAYDLPKFSDIADIFNLDGTVAGKLDGLVDITQDVYEAFAAKMPKSAEAPAELNGLYGSLSITASGEYTYTLYTWEQAVELGPVTMAAYVALQRRDEGDEALPTENFTVYVKDSEGAWDSQDLSFNVMGTNDGPVIKGDFTADVTEAGVGSSLSDDMIDGIIESTIGQITTGNDTVNDLLKLLGVDLEKFTLDLETSLKESLDGKFGTLSDANALPNADVTGKDTAKGTITVTDDDSSSFGSSPLVLLDGAKPEFKADVLFGKLTASVLNGELSIDPTALGSIVDVLKDFADLPKILEGGVSVDEIRDLLQSASGLSNIVDIFDNGFDISVLIDSIKESFEYTQEGEYGTLTLTPDVASGSYTYTYELNNDDEDTQGLGEKEVGQDSFTVKSYDIYGNETTQEITIEVEGKNDRPILSLNDGPIVLTENDEHSYTVKGTATADDADTTAELKYFVSAAAPTIDDFAKTLQGILGESNAPNAPSIAEALGDQISAWLTAEVALGAAKGLEEAAKVTADLTDAVALRATADSLQEQYDNASRWQQAALWVPLQTAKGAASLAEAADLAYANAQAATAKAEEARDDVVDGFDNIGESGFSLDSIKEYLDKDGDGQLDAEFINAAGAPELSLPGNVSSNLVTREVDGENQTFDVQEGKYGTLEINVNTGEYTYVVDPKFNDDIQALGEGEKFEESFVIYVKDDKDAWDSKEITVTINGTDDVPQITEESATLVVDESYLASGTLDGETPAAGEAGNVAKGTVEFTSAEDMDQGTITFGDKESKEFKEFAVTKNADGSLTLTNKDGFEVSSPDYGFITVDPKVTYDAASKTYTLNYTYTQDTVFEHGTTADNDDVAADADSFTIVIQDGKPGSAALDTYTVKVNIEDDAPIVSLDEGAIIKAGTVHTGTWSVDLGADGGAYQIRIDGGKNLDAVTFDNGKYVKDVPGLGKLTIMDDGTYTFDSNNKTQGEDFSFTLSATDGDGDVVSDTVTISMLSKLVVDTTSSAVIVIDASSGDLSAVESAIKQAGNAQVVLFGSQSDIDTFDMSALGDYDVKFAGSSSDLAGALTAANGIVDNLAAASSQPVNVVVACNGEQPIEVANMPNTVKFGDVPQDGHSNVFTEILFDISDKQPGDTWTSKGVVANILGDNATKSEYVLTLGVDSKGNLFVTATVVGGSKTVSTSQFSDKMLESFDSVSMIKWPGFDYASAEEQARLAAQEAAEKALKDLNKDVKDAGGELVVVGDHSLDLPKKVSTDVNDLEETIDGSKVGDILVGGMTTEDLQAVTGQTDEEEIIRTLQKDPEWLSQQVLSAYDDGGDDIINAGKGNDIAYGGAGDDTIYGGKGADTLFGGEGDDSIYGGKGADSIYGGAGADLLDGGTGDDIFFADVNDTVLGGDGNDLIIMPGFDSVNIDDVLSVDGGDGIDILLSGVTSLEGAKHLIDSGKISNVEIMMFGKDGADADAIEAAKALQEQLQGKDENTKLTDTDLTGWTNKGSSVDGYTQFESEDDKMTILIQSSLINA